MEEDYSTYGLWKQQFQRVWFALTALPYLVAIDPHLLKDVYKEKTPGPKTEGKEE